MERREFVQFCIAAAASAGSPAVAADAEPRRYARSRLVDAHGAPLHAADVPANRNLIFHYPYAATPCFLLNVGRPTAPTVLKTAAAVDHGPHAGDDLLLLRDREQFGGDRVRWRRRRALDRRLLRDLRPQAHLSDA